MKSIRRSLMVLLIVPGITAPAGESRFESPETAVPLLELYSSEGCSSCPPAEAWIAGLRREGSLWKGFVPLEFHVDYWNRLGWQDRFSRDIFTSRQRGYAAEWGTRQVYTPAFVLSGREWRGQGAGVPAGSGEKVGVLTARVRGRSIQVTFKPRQGAGQWIVYGALLGNGLTTNVGAGENAGRTLRHEFVVLKLVSSKAVPSGGGYDATLDLSGETISASSYAIAVWVSRPGSQAPVQTLGGDLPN